MHTHDFIKTICSLVSSWILACQMSHQKSSMRSSPEMDPRRIEVRVSGKCFFEGLITVLDIQISHMPKK